MRFSYVSSAQIIAIRLPWGWLLFLLALLNACGPIGNARRKLEEQLLVEAAVCNTPTVKELLKKGARLEATGENRATTPLLEAASGGCTETIEFLLKEGAEAEAMADDGSTALLLAAKQGKVGAVKSLLAAGVNPDAKDNKGYTALMYASSQAQLEIIRGLLAAGAYVGMRNYKGDSSLDLTGYIPPTPPGTSPTKLSFPLPGMGQRQVEAAALLLKNGAKSRQ
jgi:hypothetical protein